MADTRSSRQPHAEATASVLSQVSDGIATVTLNRPARHNSLVPEMLEALSQIFADLNDRDDIDVVVLRAAGRSFSTGGDLAAIAAAGADRAVYADRLVGALNTAIVAIAESCKPVIAVVDGAVTGGSLGLTLAADLLLISDRAWFAPYYARVGLSPDGGWTAMLPARIGESRARMVLLLEQRIDAKTAHDWGLAHDAVPVDQIDTRLQQWCERMRDNDAASLAAARELLRDSGYRAALDRERQQFVATVTTPTAIDGVARFVSGFRRP